MSVLYYAGLTMFVVTAALLSLVILVQKSRGTTLFSNAGPVGVAGAPKFITWLTSGLFGIFLVLAVLLNVLAR